MLALPVGKYTLSELLSQAFASIHEQILGIYKQELEGMLEDARDRIIGGKRYRRNFRYKRWGYTVRKWLQTPIGVLSAVRIPRIRSRGREIGIIVDRYLHRSKELEEILLEGYLWGLSSRRMRVWARRVFGDTVSHGSICKLKDRLRLSVETMRTESIDAETKILVVDGLWGKYRSRGTGVVLIALGVDGAGKVKLLDWLGCESERKSNWCRLFRRLQRRGLEDVELLVSDGVVGISDAFSLVWKKSPRHQYCLWHLGNDLVRELVDRSWSRKRHLLRDYWEIFDGLTRAEAQARLEAFYRKWGQKEAHAVVKLLQKEDRIFNYYHYPQFWRHRLRTTNLAEGFFSHLRTFLRRFPGWVDEDHINFVLGVYLVGMRVFHNNRENITTQKIPDALLNVNFNRIY